MDLSVQDSRREKAYREFHAHPKPWWHELHVEHYSANGNWYVASFHLAYLLKQTPDNARAFDRLHDAHDKWLAQLKAPHNELFQPNGSPIDSDAEAQISAQRKLIESATFADPEQLLPPIVREVLKLPRGTHLPEFSRAEAEQINIRIWDAVKNWSDTTSLRVAELDMVDMRRVVDLFPLGHYYNTLGVAEYRVGNYQAALDACSKSLDLLAAGYEPIDLAIITMSHWKLGNKEAASIFRDRFTEAMKHDQSKDDADCVSFGKELTATLAVEDQK